MTDGDIVLRPVNSNFNQKGPCTLFSPPNIVSITIVYLVMCMISQKVVSTMVWSTVRGRSGLTAVRAVSASSPAASAACVGGTNTASKGVSTCHASVDGIKCGFIGLSPPSLCISLSSFSLSLSLYICLSVEFSRTSISYSIITISVDFTYLCFVWKFCRKVPVLPVSPTDCVPYSPKDSPNSFRFFQQAEVCAHTMARSTT